MSYILGSILKPSRDPEFPNLCLLLRAHPIFGRQTRSICSNRCQFFEQLRLGGIDWHHTFMMPCSKSQSSLTFLRCISTIISTATGIAISTEGAKATLLITFPEAILANVHQRLGSYSGGGGRGHRSTGRFAAVLRLNGRDALVVPGVEMHRPSTLLVGENFKKQWNVLGLIHECGSY